MELPGTGIHPGLVWRFGGRPAVDALDSYRDLQVKATCTTAKRATQADSAHGRAYRLAFERRRNWLEARAACRSIAIAGRLETGIGEPGVFECQVALHPVTGLPRLAGSGLKGLLARWCFDRQARLQPADQALLKRETLLALFGSRPGERKLHAGLLTVHDAWWVPPAPEVPMRDPLEPERVTPHHPCYYAGQPGAEATEFDGPNPVPRIAVAGTMHFAIGHDGVGSEWAERCLDWLHHALAEDGAGAARQAGYGRFEAMPPAGQSAALRGGRQGRPGRSGR